MKLKKPTIEMNREFIRYYNDCKLIEVFLLPVVRVESLRLNEIFLQQICDYLHQTCKTLESIFQTKNPNLPATTTICSWRKMLDTQIIDIGLLISLRKKFEI